MMQSFFIIFIISIVANNLSGMTEGFIHHSENQSLEESIQDQKTKKSDEAYKQILQRQASTAIPHIIKICCIFSRSPA